MRLSLIQSHSITTATQSTACRHVWGTNPDAHIHFDNLVMGWVWLCRVTSSKISKDTSSLRMNDAMALGASSGRVMSRPTIPVHHKELRAAYGDTPCCHCDPTGLTTAWQNPWNHSATRNCDGQGSCSPQGQYSSGSGRGLSTPSRASVRPPPQVTLSYQDAVRTSIFRRLHQP